MGGNSSLSRSDAEHGKQLFSDVGDLPSRSWFEKTGLQVLHGLGVTDSYRAIDAAKKTLSLRSEKCS